MRKVECILEYLSFYAVRNMEWFMYYLMLKKVTNNRVHLPYKYELESIF